jgi:hypothetical protein
MISNARGLWYSPVKAWFLKKEETSIRRRKSTLHDRGFRPPTPLEQATSQEL